MSRHTQEIEKVDLSVVVPVCNEEGIIAKSADQIIKVTKEMSSSYEVIFSDDGSTDQTPEILKKICSEDPRLKIARNPTNQGKGAALSLGFSQAIGENLAYIDADLEIPTRYLQEVVQGINRGFDVCCGSKSIGKAVRERKRHLAHSVFNGLVRTVLGSQVFDHSCGVKAFRRELLESIVLKIKDKQWVWDTEFLVLAQKKGFRVKEIPVETKRIRASKVRFLSAVFKSLGAVLRLFFAGIRVPRKYRTQVTQPHGNPV